MSISRAIHVSKLVIGNYYKQITSIPNPLSSSIRPAIENNIQGKLLAKQKVLQMHNGVNQIVPNSNRDNNFVYILTFEGLEYPVSVSENTEFYDMNDRQPLAVNNLDDFSSKQKELDQISKNINTAAVNIASTSVENNMNELEKLLKKGFSDAEKAVGRPLSYSEMRQLFG